MIRTEKLIAFLLGIFIPFLLTAYTGEVHSSFKTPGNFPTGLTFDGTNIWIADRGTDQLYQLNRETGQIIRKISSPGYWPEGLAWDGQYLWNVDIKGGLPLAENYDGSIYKINPDDGMILHTIKSPTNSPRGLCWDGKFLWCVDSQKDQIIQFDPNDGTTIKSFKSPASDPRGITFDGKYLWVSDRVSNQLYMVDPKTGWVLIVADAPGEFTVDLCFDGKFIWAADHEKKEIFKLKINDGVNFSRTKPVRAKITYTHQTTNFGPGKVKELNIHLALPKNRDNQIIEQDFEYTSSPTTIVTDKWGQNTARFLYMNLAAGQNRTISLITRASIFDVRYYIYPENVGSMSSIPKEIKSLYLKDDIKYQINHPRIKSALNEAIGDEKNPYWITRKIYQYLMTKLYYEMVGGWNTAPTVLERGNGSCSEYTFVYISMCRAAGIPARYVGSVVIRGDMNAMDDVFHRWVEVYLPNYGWIPVDPSGGDSDSPQHQANYFGHLNNRYLVTTESGGGSETLDWTYNSHQFWSTLPKTLVVFENYADWEAILTK